MGTFSEHIFPRRSDVTVHEPRRKTDAACSNPCYFLFLDIGFERFHRFDPDRFSSRAHARDSARRIEVPSDG